MLAKSVKIITGFIGFMLMAVFMIGLSHSISTGFAGFWGGLPFAAILLFIVPMALYDVYDECIRKKNE